MTKGGAAAMAHPGPVRRLGPPAGLRPHHPDRASSSAEYSLALAGVAGLIMMLILGLGDQLSAMFDCLSDQLRGNPTACAPGAGGTSDGDTGGGDAGDGDTEGGPATEPTGEPPPAVLSETGSGSGPPDTSPTPTSPTTTTSTSTSTTTSTSTPATGE